MLEFSRFMKYVKPMMVRCRAESTSAFKKMDAKEFSIRSLGYSDCKFDAQTCCAYVKVISQDIYSKNMVEVFRQGKMHISLFPSELKNQKIIWKNIDYQKIVDSKLCMARIISFIEFNNDSPTLCLTGKIENNVRYSMTIKINKEKNIELTIENDIEGNEKKSQKAIISPRRFLYLQSMAEYFLPYLSGWKKNFVAKKIEQAEIASLSTTEKLISNESSFSAKSKSFDEFHLFEENFLDA